MTRKERHFKDYTREKGRAILSSERIASGYRRRELYEKFIGLDVTSLFIYQRIGLPKRTVFPIAPIDADLEYIGKNKLTSICFSPGKSVSVTQDFIKEFEKDIAAVFEEKNSMIGLSFFNRMNDGYYVVRPTFIVDFEGRYIGLARPYTDDGYGLRVTSIFNVGKKLGEYEGKIIGQEDIEEVLSYAASIRERWGEIHGFRKEEERMYRIMDSQEESLVNASTRISAAPDYWK